WESAARHPYPRTGRQRHADGRSRSERKRRRAVPRDRAQDGGAVVHSRAQQGDGFPQDRHPEYLEREIECFSLATTCKQILKGNSVIIHPKVRGFICTTAHPLGCEKNVAEQIGITQAHRTSA